jgi:hypothetical protein
MAPNPLQLDPMASSDPVKGFNAPPAPHRAADTIDDRGLLSCGFHSRSVPSCSVCPHSRSPPPRSRSIALHTRTSPLLTGCHGVPAGHEAVAEEPRRTRGRTWERGLSDQAAQTDVPRRHRQILDRWSVTSPPRPRLPVTPVAAAAVNPAGAVSSTAQPAPSTRTCIHPPSGSSSLMFLRTRSLIRSALKVASI